jgi:hypothetical protein
MKIVISIFIFGLFSVSSHAALIKWTDKSGMVHYSDTLPPDVNKTEAIRSNLGKGQASAPAAFSSKSVSEREAEIKKSKLEKSEAGEKQAQKDAESETKRHNCIAAQQNLRAFEDGTRMFTYDANGEKVFLDDAAREQRMNDARKTVSLNCI